ncbi:MAG: DUF4389 domain-containing protein [bacterium]|nr:DUF4389 domain-containing protein [bacterium]
MNSVKFNVDYPKELSRGTLLLKTFFGWLYIMIPHGIVLGVLSLIASVMSFFAWWAVLFTGKYPRGMFDFIVNTSRWGMRVSAYLGLMTDVNPPYTMDNIESPVKLEIVYPESLSRGTLLLRTFFGWLYVGVPHGIILSALGALAEAIIFICWFIILFTGKFPEGMFKLLVGYFRWSFRVGAYSGFMTDEYPPFSFD